METYFPFEIEPPDAEGEDPLHTNFQDMVSAIIQGKADPRLLPDNYTC